MGRNSFPEELNFSVHKNLFYIEKRQWSQQENSNKRARLRRMLNSRAYTGQGMVSQTLQNMTFQRNEFLITYNTVFCLVGWCLVTCWYRVSHGPSWHLTQHPWDAVSQTLGFMQVGKPLSYIAEAPLRLFLRLYSKVMTEETAWVMACNIRLYLTGVISYALKRKFIRRK